MAKFGLEVRSVVGPRFLRLRIVEPTRLVRRPKSLALLGSIVVLLGASSLVSAAAARPSSSASLKPDLKFFAGKTIVVDVGGSPGGAVGELANDIVPAMASYLKASYQLVFEPSVADAVQEDQVGSAIPNGLTLGTNNLLGWMSAIYSGSGAPSVPIRKMNWIGSNGTVPYLITACEGAPFSTFDGLVKSGTIVTDLDIAPSSSDIATRLLFAAYGIPHRYIQGYASSAAIRTGCLRGDGMTTLNLPSQLTVAAGNAMISGLTPLLVMGTVPKGIPSTFLNAEVPTAAKYAKTHPPKTSSEKAALTTLLSMFQPQFPGQALIATPGIPKSRVLALTDAMKVAMKTPSVQLALLNNGLSDRFVSGSTIVSDISTAIKNQTQMEHWLSQ